MSALDEELERLADQYDAKQAALVHSLFAYIVSDKVDGRPREKWDGKSLAVTFRTFCMERGIEFDPNPGWLDRLTARQEGRKNPFDPSRLDVQEGAARAACFETCRTGVSSVPCESPEDCQGWLSFINSKGTPK